MARVLVAGIGNIFLGDDGFGPEVIRHVGEPRWPAVRVVDYGIRGMQLAYDLLDDWDALVLVDAVPNRGCAGEVRVFQIDPESYSAPIGLDAHGMDPGAVFAFLRTLGGTPPTTVVVGCQVADTGDGIGLSAAVRAAIPGAVAALESTLARLVGQPCA